MVMVMIVLSNCYTCMYQMGGVCGLFDDLVNGTKCIFYKDGEDDD